MPKLKTHTGAKKRFSKTGTGKIKRGQTKTRHILTSKPQKSKRIRFVLLPMMGRDRIWPPQLAESVPERREIRLDESE